MEDLYLLLGVKPTATTDEILEAFDEKKVEQQIIMKSAAGTVLEEKAAKKLQLLFQAKKILTDAVARREYDINNGYACVESKQSIGFAMPNHDNRPASNYAPEQAVARPVIQEPRTTPAQPQVGVSERVSQVARPKATRRDLPELGQPPFMPKRRPVIDAKPLLIASDNGSPVYLYPKMANRHGLIAGATGTGKTVTLKVLAEHFSDIGVPVFLADIKGDVWTMCEPGSVNEKRIRTKLKMEPSPEICDPKGYPMRYWDVYGKKGHPVRTTISAMGPELLARLLELNETQSGVLNIIFRYADDNGLLILDMKDLRTMVTYCSDHAKELQTKYGNISAVSIGAIQRSLLKLEDAGGNIFFGEPALDLNDWFAYDRDGRGVINLLHCAELFQKPILYSTFLLWMLSGLYDMMPEKGDADKPEMVFFFDEAHLIFKDAPKSLLDKVEQIVRLIRSKGVGVYFISQLPADIPNSVLSQLGNKVQHALRAYTPKDQLALKSAAQSFVANPALGNLEKVLGELGTGEALVSFMGEDGKPSKVQRGYIMPPNSTLDVLDESLRFSKIKADWEYADKYQELFDRESAYELLQVRIDEAKEQAQREEEEKARQKEEAERAKQEAARAREERAEQRERERQEDREARAREREEAKRLREEEREYKRKLAEEERERKAAEREEAKRLREEEREYKRQVAEEEREYKRKMAEEAKAQREREAMIRQATSLAKSSSVQRGIFGMLKKLF